MMNQRIRELAAQCREEYPDTEWPDATHYRFDEAKFAELIIKECAGLVQGVPIDTMGYLSADQKIKQHFGVEE
jgi:hypothetical protein